MFNHEAYPGTVNFNTGAPFQPFTRNPQLRYSFTAGAVKITATAYTQRDFATYGPDPKDPSKMIASSVFLRNSAKPGLDLQVRYKVPGTEHFIGAGVDYKSIKPELFTTGLNGKFKTETELPSLSYFAYLKINTKPLTVKVYSMMGENNTDLTMLGGYASNGISDSLTGARKWENISMASAWIDIHSNHPVFRPGLYVGYSKNLGSEKELHNPVFYSRGSNIDMLFRVSPRFTYINGKLELACELETTAAAYGTTNANGRVENTNTVTNYRPHITATLNF
jgi:hypothetical protein